MCGKTAKVELDLSKPVPSIEKAVMMVRGWKVQYNPPNTDLYCKKCAE
jgi:hypothetical protein